MLFMLGDFRCDVKFIAKEKAIESNVSSFFYFHNFRRFPFDIYGVEGSMIQDSHENSFLKEDGPSINHNGAS